MLGEFTPAAIPDAVILDSRGRRITMSNALARSAHGLTLTEKRIIVLGITKLDQRRRQEVGAVSRITAVEYAQEFGVDEKNAYAQLKAAAEALYSRSIVTYTPAYKRSGKPLQPTITRMRWVGAASYQKGEGWIELHWWHQVLPHLTGLVKQFTQYQLEQASALRSVYSWKLLELLMRFQSTGWAQYDIEDFAESMEATPHMRKDFGKIRTKIIEPAVKELVEKDGWQIEWQAIKAGRRVKALKFQFRRNPQGRLDL